MTPDPLDQLFAALADPHRRRMLDRVREQPGISQGELGEGFPFTRFAVRKHLRVLEDAGLIVPRKDGRFVRLFWNPMPVQALYDSWLSTHTARFAQTLSGLARVLEEEPMSLQQVYVTYIRTTPEKLWSALIDPKMTLQYFHGTEVHVDLKPGGRLEYTLPSDGDRVALRGEVVEVVPHQRLVHTFAFPSNADAPTQVTWELEPMGGMVKLTCLHEGFPSETETFTSTREGWPVIFSGLKSLLETGEPLLFPADEK